MTYGAIVKTFISKKGNTVVVRYPKKEDVEDILRFANEIVREDTFVELCTYVTKVEEEKFLSTVLQEMEKGDRRHFSVYVGDVYAGNCNIQRLTRRKTHVGLLGIAILKEYREEGIGQELFAMMIEEAKDMGLALLELTCFENNPRALHVYEKMGFKKVGVIPGAIAYKGEFVGEVLMYLPLVT